MASKPAVAARQALHAQNAMAPTIAMPRGCRPALEPRSIRRAGAISNQGWAREFEDPIALPDGRKLRTLREAATYVTGLPKKEAALPQWQAAIEALMLVADLGGPTMFAHIGVMKALNRHVERVFDPSRKHRHWGKRQLGRDR
jgi:hypothetical protein